MRLTCSACGAHGSIEMFSTDSDARRLVELMAGVPADVGPVLVRYLGLFRPHKRGLTWDRAVKIAAEVVAMIQAGEVEQRGRRYPASAAVFASAMQQMLDHRERLELPMTSHGYLVRIVAGESPREAARAETAQESLKRMASNERLGARSRAIAELSGEIARRKRFGEAEMTEQERKAFLQKHGGGDDAH